MNSIQLVSSSIPNKTELSNIFKEKSVEILLVKEKKSSPFLSGEKASLTYTTEGFEGVEKPRNLKSHFDSNLSLSKMKESDDSHKNLHNKYMRQNKSRKILYAFERLILDTDPQYSHLTELERHYKAMNSHSTIKCLRVKTRNSDNVGIRVDHKHKKAHYTGVMVCGSPWACPLCASKIQNRRAIEIQEAFKWAYRDKQFQMMMVTLTFPHGIADDLGEMMEKLKIAMVYFRKGANYDKFKKSIGYQGMIKAQEITWGQINGWHPHTHELQIINYDIDQKEEKRISKFILNQWEMACKKAGLLKHGSIADFRKKAVHIIFHAKDSDYLAKLNNEDRAWGADKEMASASTKKGRMTGLSPFQILDQSDENEEFQNLYLEYALKMKGKRQLVWSKGLKEKVGIKDKTDEELALEESSESDLLALFTNEQWYIVLKNKDRAYVQWLAVNYGFEGLAQYFEKHGSILNAPVFHKESSLENRNDDG
ncbi:protein rep [Pelosinus sp. IPA-1]|uniref:protein rep n=1 Tax=Pelosinus sp. IPA-1 TaxID=3029569 RepID=UPI0024362105|nr:protein rep [Pelosinus sp. IPA-1]GMB02275.1 hypothetical protein PIPA1_50760 [Pelosinus sp. IPA-1]